jgi:hypothetical protein
MHLFLARDLRVAHGDRRGPDEDERLHLTAVPWRVAVAMAEEGAIQDAKSIVGLFWLARIMERPLEDVLTDMADERDEDGPTEPN